MRSPAAQIWLAFAIIYLVWGSTYLFIRIGVQDLPPVLFAGVRFAAAGPIMLVYALSRGARFPTGLADWRHIAVTSAMMLIGANALVTWSEVWVESNQAALIVATSALWMAGLGTLGGRGEKLGALTLAGLLLGFAGVAVLVGSGMQLRAAPPLAYAALLVSPVLWAGGSIYARRSPIGCSPLMTAALQMCCAGLVLTVLGLALGDAQRWTWRSESALALAYLILLGSCVAYGAYYWLVHQVTPSQLGTYAYVNPAVAVVLGWLVLDERLNGVQVLGTVVILAGVVIVTLAARRDGAKNR